MKIKANFHIFKYEGFVLYKSSLMSEFFHSLHGMGFLQKLNGIGFDSGFDEKCKYFYCGNVLK